MGYLLSVGLFTILPAVIEIGTVIGIIVSNELTSSPPANASTLNSTR